MARFRRRIGKRGSFRGSFKRFGKISGMGKSANLIQLDAMIYGGLRQAVSNAIAPLTSKIPIAGNLSDEIGMGFIDWMLAKNVKGFVSEVAKKGLVIENARVGEALVGSTFSGILGGSNNANAGSYFSNTNSY